MIGIKRVWLFRVTNHRLCLTRDSKGQKARLVGGSETTTIMIDSWEAKSSRCFCRNRSRVSLLGNEL